MPKKRPNWQRPSVDLEALSRELHSSQQAKPHIPPQAEEAPASTPSITALHLGLYASILADNSPGLGLVQRLIDRCSYVSSHFKPFTNLRAVILSQREVVNIEEALNRANASPEPLRAKLLRQCDHHLSIRQPSDTTLFHVTERLLTVPDPTDPGSERRFAAIGLKAVDGSGTLGTIRDRLFFEALLPAIKTATPAGQSVHATRNTLLERTNDSSRAFLPIGEVTGVEGYLRIGREVWNQSRQAGHIAAGPLEIYLELGQPGFEINQQT